MILLTAAASGSGAYRDTGPITTVHFVIIAVLIALTIAGLVWGMRLKRQRQAGEVEEERRVEAMEAHPPVTDDPEPTVPTQRQTQVQRQELPVATTAATVPGERADPPAPAAAGAEATPYQLLDVKGLGPKAVPLLEAQGVGDIIELAALTDARAAEIDAGMGALRGRLARDRWVEQAKLLAAGDRAGFEATFGKL